MLSNDLKSVANFWGVGLLFVKRVNGGRTAVSIVPFLAVSATVPSVTLLIGHRLPYFGMYVTLCFMGVSKCVGR